MTLYIIADKLIAELGGIKPQIKLDDSYKTDL